MLTTPRPEKDPNPPPRTGHGAASVIPRLNEQVHRRDDIADAEPAADPALREAPAVVPPKPAFP